MAEVQISKMEEKYIEPSLDLAAQVFCTSSTLHKLAGITVSEYKKSLRNAFLENVEQGLSVVAVANDQDVIGCVIACDFLDQGAIETSQKLAIMQSLFLQLEKEYIEYRAPKLGQSLLIDMALVHPDHGGGGIYQKLRAYTHEIARQKGYAFVVGELSSAATQNVVVRKMGHRVVYKVSFDEFMFEEEKPFKSIQNPKEIWLTEGVL